LNDEPPTCKWTLKFLNRYMILLLHTRYYNIAFLLLLLPYYYSSYHHDAMKFFMNIISPAFVQLWTHNLFSSASISNQFDRGCDHLSNYDKMNACNSVLLLLFLFLYILCTWKMLNQQGVHISRHYTSSASFFSLPFSVSFLLCKKHA
jgi:hypothetical protein